MMVTTKQGATPQTIANERQVSFMNKTRIFLYVLLVIGLIFEAISIVQSFTKNIPMDWASAGVFFAVLTVALDSTERRDKKQEIATEAK